MMAAAFDVAGRLAEGDGAVTVLDEYVTACQVLGLPSPGPLAELYYAESGLNLDALAADARSLDAAVVVAQDAVRLQGNGYRDLTAQWSGAGGDAAGGFLRTLTVAAEDVVAHLQRSAQALTTLRDALWRAVDAKVDAVLRADAQTAGHRDQWSAAARAVLAGAGDLSAASEIVDQQVKPFVLRAVSGDLLPALQDASDAVAAAYDSAIAAVTPAGVSFAVPVVLTPDWAPQASPAAAWPAAPAYQAAAAAPFATLGTAAGWTPPAPSASAAPPVPAEPVAAPSTPLVSAESAPAPSTPAPGGPEPALGAAAATPAATGPSGDLGFGSGIGGLGRQLTDAIGGALGSMAGLAPGVSGLGGLDNVRDGLGDDLGLGADGTDTDHEPDDAADGDADDEPDDSDAEEADEEDAAKSDAAGEEDTSGETAESDDAEPGPVDAPVLPPQQPVPGQPVADPAPTTPPVEPVAEQTDPTTKTPCEIAADELPNVGE